MATISITIPDASLARINDAFAAIYDYDPASGLTKSQFTKQQVIRLVKEKVKGYEIDSSLVTTRTTIESSVDGINIT